MTKRYTNLLLSDNPTVNGVELINGIDAGLENAKELIRKAFTESDRDMKVRYLWGAILQIVWISYEGKTPNFTAWCDRHMNIDNPMVPARDIIRQLFLSLDKGEYREIQTHGIELGFEKCGGELRISQPRNGSPGLYQDKWQQECGQNGYIAILIPEVTSTYRKVRDYVATITTGVAPIMSSIETLLRFLGLRKK